MITLEDAATEAPRPAYRAKAAPAAISLLNGALFLTILISSFVFIEPSPYEAAAILLGFLCITARVPVDRKLLLLIMLLVLFNLGGLMAAVPVLGEEKTIEFVVVSVFMAFTAVVYACLFAQDTERRLALVETAYILSGVFASIIGIIGYFSIFPGAHELFATMDRAQSTFKDPNVFGPFLIFPILLLVQGFLSNSLKLRYLIPLFIMLLGLFLSFSRGAWFHFVLSAATMVGLMFLTASDLRMRGRLVVMTALALAAFAALLVFALSFDAIGDMFTERAKLFQSYDAGTNMGRFNLQVVAVDSLLQNPFGLGPFEFARTHGLQQHNVYLQAFLVYSWLGGLSYIFLILLTLAIGFRAVLVATPWQPFLIVSLATFVGVVAEGAVIDTDHWRHFFLLLGSIWGLTVATMNQSSRRRHREWMAATSAPS